MFKENIMEWNHFKANSIEGVNFLLGLMETEKQRAKARTLFTLFIKENGFTAWHIHDGWVMHDHENGDVLHHEDIRITWIDPHAGYSHVWRCPDVGEQMIIITNSPDGKETKPFNLYCYKVIEKEHTLSDTIKLKHISIIQAIFNTEEMVYQLYIKKRIKMFRQLRRKFNI